MQNYYYANLGNRFLRESFRSHLTIHFAWKCRWLADSFLFFSAKITIVYYLCQIKWDFWMRSNFDQICYKIKLSPFNYDQISLCMFFEWYSDWKSWIIKLWLIPEPFHRDALILTADEQNEFQNFPMSLSVPWSFL